MAQVQKVHSEEAVARAVRSVARRAEVAMGFTVLDVTDSVLGCSSEVGTLRAVVLHRPGPELQRLTPRNNDTLLFDGLPWVAKAQEEHDAFAALLRSRGVEVLLLALYATPSRVSRMRASVAPPVS